MIRYRLLILMLAALAALAHLGAWRAADQGPQVASAGEGLALPLDDAAIYLQYSRQALRGEWLRYNPGAELSTGVTSPLYFGLLTALMGLGLNGPLAAWLLGAAAFVLGLVCMDRLAARLFPALPPWWAAALLLCQGAWAAWSFNGMESGLLLALSLAASLAALKARGSSFLAVAAALAFTRPEGQVLAGLLGMAWAWQRKSVRDLLWVGMIAAAPSALLWALSGSMVPDSMRPKSASLMAGQDAWGLMARSSDYAVGLIKGLWMGFWGGRDAVGLAGDAQALNPSAPLYPPLLLLAAVFGFFARAQGAQRGFWLAIACALAGVAALLAWQLPVGWHVHRYSAGAAPLLWLGALGALQALRTQGGLGRPASAALFALWAAFGLASWPWHLQRNHAGALAYAQANRNAALAAAQLPEGPVAVADAGLLTYYSGRETVDLLGITDHRLALAQAHGRGAVLEALMDRQHPPRWAVLHQDRPDMNLEAWLRLGLLKPVPGWAPGRGMTLYAWDWHQASRRSRPQSGPAGWTLEGSLNVALLADEARAGYAALGPQAGRSRALNLRVADGAQVPEGGREVLEERLVLKGEALVARAVFDRPGRLIVRGADGRKLLESMQGASPSGGYSEAFLPLPSPRSETLQIAFLDEKGQPTPWVSCHYWSLRAPVP